MWLFGKNHWGPPWTGYGIAVSRDGLHPWPHLGLGRDGAVKGVQLRHARSLGQELGIVEIRYDGQRLSQLLDGHRARGLAVRAGILTGSFWLLQLLGAVMTAYGVYVCYLMLRRPEELAVEENHVSWTHMYRMMFVAQVGFALAYLL